MSNSKEFFKCKSCNEDYSIVNEKFNLVKCNVCHFIFSKKQFSIEEFIETYDNLYNSNENPKYKKHSVVEYENLKANHFTIGYNRKMIVDKIIKDGRGAVLEIGSGVGLIGMYLKKFKDINYIGIEIDKKTHEKALSLGINSINGNFSKMSDVEGNFDIIMLWEVLEHIQDISLFFQLAHEKLKTEGLLVFSVPNYNKRLNYPKEKRGDQIYQSAPPIHLNFFTEQSISNVLNTHGFLLKKIRTKKFPYFNPKNKTFYKMLYKAFIGNYQGATIYTIATKK